VGPRDVAAKCAAAVLRKRMCREGQALCYVRRRRRANHGKRRSCAAVSAEGNGRQVEAPAMKSGVQTVIHL